jgi:L-rhamnose isomerase
VIISSENNCQLEEIARRMFTKFVQWAVKNRLGFDKNKTEAV